MTSKQKGDAIAEATESIAVLNGDIEKYEADAARLTREIGKLNDQISGWEGDIKASTNVRDKEHADFLRDQQDFSESVEQVGMGIDTIKETQGNVGQAAAAAFTQISKLPAVSAAEKRKVEVFLQRDPE